MGMRALCAAAIVAAGVGQAEAATVDRVKLTLTAEYICEINPCEDAAPNVGKFYGVETGKSVFGDLYIGDPDQDWLQTILFISKGTAHNFGQFSDFGENAYLNEFLRYYYTAFVIEWNRSEGSIWYRDDNAPWSLEVLGTIELAPVPLPATAALLSLGLSALALMRRRRRPV